MSKYQSKLVSADHLKIVDAKAGKMWIIKSDTTVSANIINLGHWAWEHVEIFKHLVPKNGLFVDLGAYIGHHSVAMLNYLDSNGFVISVEGSPKYAEILENNLQMQKKGNYKVLNIAISDVEGRIQIPDVDTSSNSNFGSLSFLDEAPSKNQVEIQTQTLDNIMLDLPEKKVSLIKMDIQSYEYFAIKGAQTTILNDRPFLFIEISPYLMKSKAKYDYRSIYLNLMSKNYVIFNLLGGFIDKNWAFDPLDYVEGHEWDILAVPREKLPMLDKMPWM